MKGLVLTEFVDFVAARHPAHQPAPPPITPLGQYPDATLYEMVDATSRATGTTRDALLEAFGAHLFARLVATHPVFAVDADSALDFLATVNDRIHDQVREIHPDAVMPHFELRRLGRDALEMTYRSDRPLAALAAGMIRGCLAHFGEAGTLDVEPLDGGEGRVTRFVVHAAAPAASG